jgi:hypothetical protein
MVTKVSQKTLFGTEMPGIHPYSVTDPIPVPKAIESDTDTAWALWQDHASPSGSAPHRSYQKTVPAELMPSLPVKPRSAIADRRSSASNDRRKSDSSRRSTRSSAVPTGTAHPGKKII